MNKTLLLSVHAIAFFLAIAASLAQPSPEVADPSSKKIPKAQLRVFVFPFENASGAVVARAVVKGMDAPAVITSAPAGRNHTDEAYQDFPAGQGAYEFLSADKPVANGQLGLMPNRAYTIVAWQGADRAWQSKLFADDSSSASRPMRVLNFVPGRQSTVATEGTEGAAVAATTVQELQAPAKVVDIRAKVQNPEGGPPFQTSTAFDFSQAGSGYLLIALDYRGKPDVKVLPGGFVAAAPQEAAPSAAPVVVTAADIQKEAKQTEKRSLAYIKSALADLEKIQAGPNKIPNADAIRRDLQQQLRALESPAPPPPQPTPAAAN